jgi:quercetin dioxygenase-like cupin family protein
MEENFFVLKGKVEFVVDGVSHIGEQGDLYSMEPKESHYLKNVGEEEAIIAFFLTPFKEGDKVTAPL